MNKGWVAHNAIALNESLARLWSLVVTSFMFGWKLLREFNDIPRTMEASLYNHLQSNKLPFSNIWIILMHRYCLTCCWEKSSLFVYFVNLLFKRAVSLKSRSLFQEFPVYNTRKNNTFKQRWTHRADRMVTPSKQMSHSWEERCAGK